METKRLETGPKSEKGHKRAETESRNVRIEWDLRNVNRVSTDSGNRQGGLEQTEFENIEKVGPAVRQWEFATAIEWKWTVGIKHLEWKWTVGRQLEQKQTVGRHLEWKQTMGRHPDWKQTVERHLELGNGECEDTKIMETEWKQTWEDTQS